ncbi:hypothetical protein [Winogradskyella forsetii]|uniref:hypothetical protein n=1 Tax=Winogradskyella forsetii TaxID=2686077 RepID=UPI0015BD5578|nr:hypothetical protein [Winogradskyella forsetii]
MDITELQNRIQNAKALDFGTIFNQSIELFKKVWVQGLVTLLLNLVLAIPFIMIVYIPLIFMGFMDLNSAYYDPYEPYAQPDVSPVFFLVMAVVYIFMIVAMSTIGLGLKAAFYRICKLKDLEQMGKEDYFYFFKKPYLGKTVKLGLAFSGISILATLLCVLPIIYAIVPLSFMVVVYAFNPDLSISEIVKLSFDLGNKKWLISFGLLFVSGVLAGIVGMLMCFVGIYLTASFSYLPIYFIYKEVIGFDEESDQMHRLEKLSTI